MKLYTYELKEHQKRILNEVKTLPLKSLHYVVGQQSLKYPVFTLNELKKHIKRGIKNYIKEWEGYNYKPGTENEYVKYYCFFETSKEFFWSQYKYGLNDQDIDMRFHFHLFVSPNPNICFEYLLHSIFSELTSQRNKRGSLTKYDYKQLDKLNDNFVLYHTKQMMFYNSPELVMKNI